jgi:hypothetical protein
MEEKFPAQHMQYGLVVVESVESCSYEKWEAGRSWTPGEGERSATEALASKDCAVVTVILGE